MLVEYWANIFNKSTTDEQSKYSKTPDFSIKYVKENIPLSTNAEKYEGDKENSLDFVYISQSHLKLKAKKEEIEEEIKKLLGLNDSTFSNDLSDRITCLNDKIVGAQNWFLEKDENNNELNNEELIKKSLKETKGLLESITTETNKEKLKKYTSNINSIQTYEGAMLDMTNLLTNIDTYINVTNKKIEVINNSFKEIREYKSIKEVSLNEQVEKIKSNIKIIKKEIEQKQKENFNVKKEFENLGIKTDLSSLLINAEKYQLKIANYEKHLIKIQTNKDNLKNQLEGRAKISSSLNDEYARQKKEIDEAWKNILNMHEDYQKDLIKKILLKKEKIKISGEIYFNKREFYSAIHNKLDRRKYKSIKSIEGVLKISDFESWIEFIAKNMNSLIGGDNDFKFIIGIIFNREERGQYLKVLPKITYDGKDLSKLSVGQRGTIYLCISLATNAFSTPIIFDQPEDDLDNKFIVNELVCIFRELKKYRQIIIVTHNANLVVNTDAEQVIIANNENEVLTYKSGSLENKDIIDSACEILEGGEEAFRRRRERYQF